MYLSIILRYTLSERYKSYKRIMNQYPYFMNPGSILPVFEFHIEKNLRARYEIDEAMFSLQGSIVFADFNAVRLFVHKLNARRDPLNQLYPGEVYAAGLMEEVFHFILRMYEQEINTNVFDKAIAHLRKGLGEQNMISIIADMVDIFPPTEIYQGKTTINNYLSGKTGKKANLHISLEEAMMLFIANFNPANKKLRELFDDKYLNHPDAFRLMMDHLEDFFEEQPTFGPDNQDIFSLLKSPILHAPDDISKQLDYIMGKWQSILPENIFNQLLRGHDLLKEDVRFENMGIGGPPSVAPVYRGKGNHGGQFGIGKSGYKFVEESDKDYDEPEAFTPDIHWMPSVVMLAKNTFVWMDQLSRKYGREIRTLDQIPDEELDLLKKWNFTGLWLIGIWERSEASKQIKHIMGNKDAVSSAYSLFDYQIAHSLGGDSAYENLNQRARQRGIRLASDMVPNHTGIFSKWVVENPDYYIQTAKSPFPGYTFTGEDLSDHPDVEIKLEDGYYTKTDAAVVFQWKNTKTGQTRYMYHGNDGTMMPWNDTAQLDMLKHEVRQAVIGKIFEVARKFSIIRFDAAMTLAKKHFARLWYPKPGTGGDIPSRADYSMTQREFDNFFPIEFWREVVDRMNAEMPETLLLAEAFWFMEGYFVRTLGMHRVYNSAFMHMLKNEENEKYRDLITNTLEFEPEILKRYVNFMSNPDEETAIRQFGTDDKYFGVALLMNTLPGLPMFAHGQIEGYTEKYGMEYQRAYYNESPKQWLVEKHQKELFPVTRKRYLFSEIDNFNIFDFIDSYGNINENVFAYTNRFRDEKALIMYNNKYENVSGRILFSAPKLARVRGGKEVISVSLAQALNIKGDDGVYYVLREHISGLEYLKRGRDIYHDGIHWELKPFEYRLFWDVREIIDHSGVYEKLLWKAGAGVPSVSDAIEEIKLEPLHNLFQALFSEDLLNFLINRVMDGNRNGSEKLGFKLLKARFQEFASEVFTFFTLREMDISSKSERFIDRVMTIEKAFDFILKVTKERMENIRKYGISAIDEIMMIGPRATYRENMIILLAVFTIESLFEDVNKEIVDDLDTRLNLNWPLLNLLKRTGRGDQAIKRDIQLIRLLSRSEVGLCTFIPEDQTIKPDILNELSGSGLNEKIQFTMKDIFSEQSVQELIGVNEYEAVTYYSKEDFEELIDWLFTRNVLALFEKNNDFEEVEKPKQTEKLLQQCLFKRFTARKMSDFCGYELEKLRKEIY
jgi:glycosidase